MAYKDNAKKLTKHYEHRAKLRAVVMEYLNDHPCADCGERDVVVLEFDHVRGKRIGISRLMLSGGSIRVLMEEIAKCDVVCANCHRRRTYMRSGSYRLTDT
jgi:hypothetical protein